MASNGAYRLWCSVVGGFVLQFATGSKVCGLIVLNMQSRTWTVCHLVVWVGGSVCTGHVLKG